MYNIPSKTSQLHVCAVYSISLYGFHQTYTTIHSHSYADWMDDYNGVACVSLNSVVEYIRCLVWYGSL